MCLPPQVKPPSITTCPPPPSATSPTPIPSGNHHAAVCVCEDFYFSLNFFTFLTQPRRPPPRGQLSLRPPYLCRGFYFVCLACPFLIRPQNKEFVCRGHDYERLEAFQQRMLTEFPHAIAMQHANQPDETIFQAEAQCIRPRAHIPAAAGPVPAGLSGLLSPSFLSAHFSSF